MKNFNTPAHGDIMQLTDEQIDAIGGAHWLPTNTWNPFVNFGNAWHNLGHAIELGAEELAKTIRRQFGF
jgi:hypothetical protein